MNFAEFQIWREEKVRTRLDALDCAETNLYRSLTALRPNPDKPADGRRIHRCDLARMWLRRYGFAESDSRGALVCRGVRHALNLIFGELARTNASVWMPGDVYPVYTELARAAGLKPLFFPTLPEPELPTQTSGASIEYLLAVNPWKPLGRFINEGEAEQILEWLNGSERRRVIVDCVYDLGTPLHPSTQKLAQTGRAIILHSVTKGWLWPKTFGVAWSRGFSKELETAFRSDPPSQEQLYLGEKFLGDYAKVPEKVVGALEKRNLELLQHLPSAVAESLLTNRETQNPGNYFFAVRVGNEELLAAHNVIAIPASAFGGNWGGSILSSLSPYVGGEPAGGKA
jgi:hypothetical protein